jgi:hypothetical protein
MFFPNFWAGEIMTSIEIPIFFGFSYGFPIGWTLALPVQSPHRLAGRAPPRQKATFSFSA